MGTGVSGAVRFSFVVALPDSHPRAKRMNGEKKRFMFTGVFSLKYP
jgi:hypothetical protein